VNHSTSINMVKFFQIQIQILILFNRYVEKLKNAEKAGVRKALLLGGSMGVFHIVIFSCYALAFW